MKNPASLPYNSVPDLGFGLGLRTAHYPHIFEHWPDVDWFEIISENFMDTDGRPKANLERIAERYPIVMHGVALSIGTVDPLNSEYMQKLKKLVDWLDPAWISDHLCWTGIAHRNSHDLLPVPYTEEALAHIIARIKQVQDYLERPIALENPSTYLEFEDSSISEADFIAQMANESGCNLLLDVNNVYVTCYNHRLDPKRYLDSLPMDRVTQIHLSGHTNKGSHIIDTHDDHVIDEVWELYRYVVQKAQRTPNTMIEWDDNIPSFQMLYAELEKAKVAAKNCDQPIIFPDLTGRSNSKKNIESSEMIMASMKASAAAPLHLLQGTMQDSILPSAISPLRADEWIRNKEGFSPQKQLEVYQNAYRFRLYNVTAAEYVMLKRYLGDDVFDALLDRFVQTALSTHFNIGRYSTMLPAFMKEEGCYDAFSCELAYLENAITQIADMEETAPLTSADLEGMTPEVLLASVLKPRAALELCAFEYPVNSYYRAIKEEEPLPTNLNEKGNGCYLAIFRHENVVWRMELDRLEYCMLSHLFSGRCVEDALAQLQVEEEVSEEVLASSLSNWFSRWIRNGLLAA